MSISEVTLIVDDQSPLVQYHCPVDKQTVKGSYFRNTWTSINSLACGQQSGWFSHVFNGTRARIWASAAEANRNYSVKIDNGPFLVQSGDGYFESPILTDGLHTITYSDGALNLYPAFDYLTVTAGSSTQLLGRTVIVDDSAIIEYSGQWSTQSVAPLILSRPSAVYQNTTHWTSTVGDAFTFQFNGNSVAVYGVVPNNTEVTANSSVTCVVDGVSTVVPVPPGSNQVQAMAQFFHADLEPGMHTLVFNVTDLAPSQLFGIDFVVYNSSLDATPSGSVTAPITASSKKTGHHTGTIVAATFGSLAALVLVGLFFFIHRRRTSRKLKTKSDWDVVTKADQ
ncbi:hypothetical protein C8R43DRAFT_179340 [Mycena crocata]|nr:hypothetical protein C8R43DRAFT_179340 [Mycena crocata]